MQTSGDGLPVGIRSSAHSAIAARRRRATAFLWSLLLAIAGALALSAPALAISASVGGTSGTKLVLRPDAGELFVAQVAPDADEDGWTGEFLLVTSDDPINNGTGCEPWFASTKISKCRAVAGQPAGGITRIDMVGSSLDDLNTATTEDSIVIKDVGVPSSLVGLAGDDNLSVLSLSTAEADTIDGGAGDDDAGGGLGADTISGDQGEDFLRGGEGNDPSVSGGPGNDLVVGENGNDNVSGGDDDDEVFGDDTFEDRPGDGTDTIDGGAGVDILDGGFLADTVTGGIGIDTATYNERNPSTPTGLKVTLDNVRNDGETNSAGTVTENDNVGPDGSIENLTGPFSAANATVTLVGNDGPNILSARTNSGVAFLDGRGGNDTLNGGSADGSGFIGGAGDDEINGTSSDDSMVGGTGVDTLNGFSGGDTLRSDDDGTGGDRVNCSSGADVAFVDFDDFTDGLCETLTSTTPPPPPPPPDTTPPPGEGGVPLNTFTTASPDGLRLPVTVPGPGLVTVAEAAGKSRAQEGPPKQTMLSLKPSSATATAPGTVNVTLKLARKAKKKYKQGKTVKVGAAVSFTPTGGTTNTTTLSLKLKK
jgi:Ca2+-binding RTX toxin-like protein